MLKSSAMEWKAKRQTVGNNGGGRPVDIPQGANVNRVAAFTVRIFGGGVVA